MLIDHNLFIHSPIDNHLGYLHFGAIICKSTVNICVQIFSFPLCKHLRVESLGQMISVHLVLFFKITKHISSLISILYSHQWYVRVLSIPHPHRHLRLSSLFKFSTMIDVFCFFLIMLLCPGAKNKKIKITSQHIPGSHLQ